LTVLPTLSTFTLADGRDRKALTAALVPVVASKHAGYEELIAGERGGTSVAAVAG